MVMYSPGGSSAAPTNHTTVVGRPIFDGNDSPSPVFECSYWSMWHAHRKTLEAKVQSWDHIKIVLRKESRLSQSAPGLLHSCCRSMETNEMREFASFSKLRIAYLQHGVGLSGSCQIGYWGIGQNLYFSLKNRPLGPLRKMSWSMDFPLTSRNTFSKSGEKGEMVWFSSRGVNDSTVFCVFMIPKADKQDLWNQVGWNRFHLSHHNSYK